MKDLTILRLKRPNLWVQLLEPRILLAKLFVKSDPEEALNVLESGKVNKSDPNWNEFKILVSFLSVV